MKDMDDLEYAMPCGQRDLQTGFQIFADARDHHALGQSTLSCSANTLQNQGLAKNASRRMSIDDQENINPMTGAHSRVEAAHRRATAAAAANATPQPGGSLDSSAHTPNQLLKDRQPLKDVTPLFSKPKRAGSEEPGSFGSTAKKTKILIKEATRETAERRAVPAMSLSDRLKAAREKRPEASLQSTRALRSMR